MRRVAWEPVTPIVLFAERWEIVVDDTLGGWSFVPWRLPRSRRRRIRRKAAFSPLHNRLAASPGATYDAGRLYVTRREGWRLYEAWRRYGRVGSIVYAVPVVQGLEAEYWRGRLRAMAARELSRSTPDDLLTLLLQCWTWWPFGKAVFNVVDQLTLLPIAKEGVKSG